MRARLQAYRWPFDIRRLQTNSKESHTENPVRFATDITLVAAHRPGHQQKFIIILKMLASK